MNGSVQRRKANRSIAKSDRAQAVEARVCGYGPLKSRSRPPLNEFLNMRNAESIKRTRRIPRRRQHFRALVLLVEERTYLDGFRFAGLEFELEFADDLFFGRVRVGQNQMRAGAVLVEMGDDVDVVCAHSLTPMGNTVIVVSPPGRILTSTACLGISFAAETSPRRESDSAKNQNGLRVLYTCCGE